MLRRIVLAFAVFAICLQAAHGQVPGAQDITVTFGEESNATHPTLHTVAFSAPCPSDCFYRILTVPNTLLTLTDFEVPCQFSFTSKYRQFGVATFWYLIQCNPGGAFQGLVSQPAKVTVTITNQPNDIQIFGWAKAMGTGFNVDEIFHGGDNFDYNGAYAPIQFIDYDAAANVPETNYTVNWKVVDDFDPFQAKRFQWFNKWLPDFDYKIVPVLAWKTAYKASNSTGDMFQIYNRRADKLGYFTDFGPFKMGTFGAGQYPQLTTDIAAKTVIPNWDVFRFYNTFTIFANNTANSGAVQRSGSRQLQVFFTPFGSRHLFRGLPQSPVRPMYSDDATNPYILRSMTGYVDHNLYQSDSAKFYERGRWNVSMGFLAQGSGEVRFGPLFAWGWPEALHLAQCADPLKPDSDYNGCPKFFENLPPVMGQVGYLADADQPNAACDYSQSNQPYFAVRNDSAAFKHYYKLPGTFPSPTSTAGKLQTSSNITICFKPHPDYFGPVAISWFTSIMTSQSQVRFRGGTIGSQGMATFYIREAKRAPTCAHSSGTFTFPGLLTDPRDVYIGGVDPDWKDRAALLLNVNIPLATSAALTLTFDGNTPTTNMTSTNNAWKVTVIPKMLGVQDTSLNFTYTLTDSTGLVSSECSVELKYNPFVEPAFIPPGITPTPTGAVSSSMASLLLSALVVFLSLLL